MKYEYKIIYLPHLAETKPDIEYKAGELNKVGEEGWKLQSVVHGQVGGWYYLMKEAA